MWNYIKGLLRVGIPIKTVYFGMLALAFDFFVLASWLVPIIKGDGIGANAIVFIVFITPAIVMTSATVESLKEYAVVPYWGRKFGKKSLFKLLAEDKFTAYVRKDGKKCRSIKISESGRWMKIAGRYYPIPFIRGIDYSRNAWTLVFINGEKFELPGLFGKRTIEALKEIFPPMKTDESTMTEDDIDKYNILAFEEAWDKPIEELAKADWFEIRYNWEKKYADIVSSAIPRSKKKRALRRMTDEDHVYKVMFCRVLANKEIKAIAEEIRKGGIERPYALFDITNYSDEFCICNGIKVLDSMGYPANKEWIGFLFDCLKDVQKSYCDDAVAVLKNHYPKEELIEHIDADIVKAHEANDLVWAAGLISLAKAIDYEITLEDNKADKDKEKEVSVCGTI